MSLQTRSWYRLPSRRIYLPTGHVITIAKTRETEAAELNTRADLLLQYIMRPSRFVHPLLQPLFCEPGVRGQGQRVKLIPKQF